MTELSLFVDGFPSVFLRNWRLTWICSYRTTQILFPKWAMCRIVVFLSCFYSRYVMHEFTDYWYQRYYQSTMARKQYTDFFLVRMFDFCSCNCYFTYNNITYKQIFGTPMRSPICCDATFLLMDEFLMKAREEVKTALDYDIKKKHQYQIDRKASLNSFSRKCFKNWWTNLFI